MNAAQRQRLQALTQDQPELQQRVTVGTSGRWQRSLAMRSHDVLLLTLQPVTRAR